MYNPDGSDNKQFACNAGDMVSIPGLGRRIFHGQRRQAGYSPLGHKKSDTTEQLTLLLSFVL